MEERISHFLNADKAVQGWHLIRHLSLPGSYRAVVKEPLDVVYQDAGHGGAVGVVEDAPDLHALGRLREAHHILGAGKVNSSHA